MTRTTIDFGIDLGTTNSTVAVLDGITFAPILPAVTVIIAAFNEEKDIARKLAMVLSLDYPADKRQIIVASDCSTDRTGHRASRSSNPTAPGLSTWICPASAKQTLT